MSLKYILIAAGLLICWVACGNKQESIKKNKDMYTVSDSENIRKAYFASGCFWGTEYYFMKADGVIDTSVGYMGGHVDNPTYQQVSGKKPAIWKRRKLSMIYQRLLMKSWLNYSSRPMTLHKQTGRDRISDRNIYPVSFIQTRKSNRLHRNI